MAVVSISLPDSLLAEVDAHADEHGYTARSEIVREGLRTVLSDADRADETPQLATFVVCFEYGDTRAERLVSRARHDAGDLVIAHAHGHAENRCFEFLLTYGTAAERRELAAELRSVSGVRAVEQSVSSVTETALPEAAD